MLLKNFMVYQEKTSYSGFKSLDNGRIDVRGGDTGGVRNRTRVLRVFETCMEDDARDWYESKIKRKNWELQNILDGVCVATIHLFRAMNNGAIAGLNANQFRGQASIVHRNAGVINTIT